MTPPHTRTADQSAV
ncbi:Protein of unknown function [Propionibacterium freudenreichii]|nr:Protein of unknown function [Propionibacterium freudenreichii]